MSQLVIVFFVRFTLSDLPQTKSGITRVQLPRQHLQVPVSSREKYVFLDISTWQESQTYIQIFDVRKGLRCTLALVT